MKKLKQWISDRWKAFTALCRYVMEEEVLLTPMNKKVVTSLRGNEVTIYGANGEVLRKYDLSMKDPADEGMKWAKEVEDMHRNAPDWENSFNHPELKSVDDERKMEILMECGKVMKPKERKVRKNMPTLKQRVKAKYKQTSAEVKKKRKK